MRQAGESAVMVPTATIKINNNNIMALPIQNYKCKKVITIFSGMVIPVYISYLHKQRQQLIYMSDKHDIILSFQDKMLITMKVSIKSTNTTIIIIISGLLIFPS